MKRFEIVEARSMVSVVGSPWVCVGIVVRDEASFFVACPIIATVRARGSTEVTFVIRYVTERMPPIVIVRIIAAAALLHTYV